MSDDADELFRRLDELKDALERIGARHDEALAMQLEQLELARRQVDRAEHLQSRQEALQDRSASIMRSARTTLLVLLPVVAALILWVGWILVG